MNLQYRIDLLDRLGQYLLSDEIKWLEVKERAGQENGWFTPEFVTNACQAIAKNYLRRDVLQQWTAEYKLNADSSIHSIGVVMAGNIPLAGFHDWLSVFISGNLAIMKPSTKDSALIRHLTEKMIEWDPAAENYFQFASLLKGCEAYIATGSYNSSRYFEYYFGKFPHIIRRNRTSVSILTGEETYEELELLADDILLYFGLGCRNVTQIYVPAGYDFLPLLAALKKYHHLIDHHKYKNNYDYNLALHLLNKVVYMTNGSVLLIEDQRVFSPISQLNYWYYSDRDDLLRSLQANTDVQCIVAKGSIPFGKAQFPALNDYADGVDTLAFLSDLPARDKNQ